MLKAKRFLLAKIPFQLSHKGSSASGTPATKATQLATTVCKNVKEALHIRPTKQHLQRTQALFFVSLILFHALTIGFLAGAPTATAASNSIAKPPSSSTDINSTNQLNTDYKDPRAKQGATPAAIKLSI